MRVADSLLFYIAMLVASLFAPTATAEEPNDDAAFIIVAPQSFCEALGPFVEFKSQQKTTRLVALEDALDDAAGVDDPERLKQFLYRHWKDHGLRYVLLVGDADVMPVRYMVLDRNTEAAFNYAFYPSDLYYSDLAKQDGSFESWNAQQNGIHGHYYGEVRGEHHKDDPINFDDVDYRPDVAVGRWPVSTVEQVMLLVNKSIAHERAMMERDSNDKPTAAAIACGGWIENRGMMDRSASRLGDGWSIEKRYFADAKRNDNTPPPNAEQVVDLFNGGASLILHSGHGTDNGWHESIDTRHLSQLANAHALPIVFSAGCSTARFASCGPYEDYLDVAGVEQNGTNDGAVFTEPPPPPGPYQTGRFNHTGLGERLLRDGPGGAIAYIGCNTGSQPCGMTLLDGFCKAVGELESPRLGECWSAAIDHYFEAENLATIEPTESWYPASIFFQGMKFMCFGDPTLPIGAPVDSPEDVSNLVEEVRDAHDVPGLLAAMVRGDELVAIGAAGVRKSRNETPVSIDDQFHIGSCTKSMTATVAAMLIEDGLLTWETTIAEALPNLAPDIHEQYRDVTLRMLLTHRSGLPEDRSPSKDIWPRIASLSGPMHQQRIEAMKLALNQEPEAAPGEAMNYSNFGYVAAGAMMEEVTGKTWEELLRTRLFEPLGMTSAGFGPPGAGDEIDDDAPAQPWGHRGAIDKLAAMRPGPAADNPLLLGPAGTVHCNVADWAKYASFHLNRGEGTDLLPTESFDVLHAPQFEGGYALGWGVATRPWAGGKTLSHSGSNGMWYATIWLAPERGVAFLAACNVGGDAGAQATDRAVSAIIRELNDMSRPNERP